MGRAIELGEIGGTEPKVSDMLGTGDDTWPTDRPDERALSGSVANFIIPRGSHILDRLVPHHNWIEHRRREGTLPYSKSLDRAAQPTVAIRDALGIPVTGVNFASQDYLSLSCHPSIRSVAKQVIDDMGLHSAGSPALMGNTKYSLELERVIAEFTDNEFCSLYPTGWAAGYGIIKALVTRHDHVIIDRLAHACLQEGASNATVSMRRFAHLSIDEVREHLRKIRTVDSKNGILVVTESLFSMDADTPDLAKLQDLCSEYEATLLVDCAHDLGCMGATGRGQLEAQGVIGKVDLVMGSFSKTFASNGGFVATRHPALQAFVRYASNPHTFSNALSPVQASVVLEAFRIISSPEGTERRRRLAENVTYLRDELSAAGFEVLGTPSPIVPVLVGQVAYARVLTRELMRRGGIVNLVEYPAVSSGSSRYRLQVMADHETQHIDRLIELLREACSVTDKIIRP